MKDIAGWQDRLPPPKDAAADRNTVAGNPPSVMRQMGRGSDGGEPRPPMRRGRHRVDGRSAGHSSRVRGKVFGALMSSVIVVLTGIAWITYHDVSTGITTSAALDGAPPSIGVDQNILIMGLDSRRDQQGQPLPQDILDAMHAGDESSGNYDADVLIVVHMPAGDGPVIAISIPRDDYVDLPGCPTSDCQGKIKAAYRLAYESVMDPRGAGDGQSPRRRPTHPTSRRENRRPGRPAAEPKSARSSICCRSQSTTLLRSPWRPSSRSHAWWSQSRCA